MVREYLHHLQQRSKWMIEENNVKLGNIVLIKEDNLPPTHWKIGQIEQLHPGWDGLVKVVTVRTENTRIKRSLAKLAILPIPVTEDN